jgi:signal transduction histidine kinase
LQEQNKFRMDFLNAAAHDLKTPLTPLRAQLATLRLRGGTDARQMAALDLMERNVNRFQALVEDMLDAARLQAGRLSLKKEPVRLAPMALEAVASFEQAARDAGIDITTTIDRDVHIEADPGKTMQVLINLVSNGVKFSAKGSRVTVKVGGDDRHGFVSVQDAGLGMTREQLGRLFQPFVRLHEDVPGTARGTGLGLYISRGIMEQHGGTLRAQSDGPGKGSTFIAEWPQIEASADRTKP